MALMLRVYWIGKVNAQTATGRDKCKKGQYVMEEVEYNAIVVDSINSSSRIDKKIEEFPHTSTQRWDEGEYQTSFIVRYDNGKIGKLKIDQVTNSKWEEVECQSNPSIIE